MSDSIKEAKEVLKKQKAEAKEMEENNEFYDDPEALESEDIEGDLIKMIEDDMPKGMFVSSCDAMLGPEWMTIGEEIVRESNPELLGKFLSYAD